MTKIERTYKLPTVLAEAWTNYLTENRLNANAVVESMISERLKKAAKAKEYKTLKNIQNRIKKDSGYSVSFKTMRAIAYDCGIDLTEKLPYTVSKKFQDILKVCCKFKMADDVHIAVHSVSGKNTIIIDAGEIVCVTDEGHIHVRISLDAPRVFKFDSEGNLLDGCDFYWLVANK